MLLDRWSRGKLHKRGDDQSVDWAAERAPTMDGWARGPRETRRDEISDGLRNGPARPEGLHGWALWCVPARLVGGRQAVLEGDPLMLLLSPVTGRESGATLETIASR